MDCSLGNGSIGYFLVLTLLHGLNPTVLMGYMGCKSNAQLLVPEKKNKNDFSSCTLVGVFGLDGAYWFC